MFIVDTGVSASSEAVKGLFSFWGLEKSPLAGANFAPGGSSFGGVAQGLDGINMGAVAGASAQSAGAFDIAMYAALMVFLLGSLYLLHEKRLV